jgi:uncharacterized repeat protein (TIGR01451 family)
VFRLKEEKQLSRALPGIAGVLWALSLMMWSSAPAWALGTAAGTVIANTATVTYTLGVDPTAHTATAFDSFEVLEIIDTVIVWQDAAAVTVNTPQTQSALTFLLTNTGNGPEAFSLSAFDALSGDDFDPSTQSIWLETNGLPGVQTSGSPADTPLGTATPDLLPDDTLFVYLLCNIPSGLSDGDTGQARLSAAAATAGAAGAPAGTELTGAGFNGASAIVGNGNADSAAIGTFIVATVDVQVTKSIAGIEDLSGGSEPYPGARVTYRLTVQISGGGTAEDLTITDAIPVDMTYLSGSTTLNGSAQTDAADAPVDNTDFNVTSANRVTVGLGDTVAPATHTIEFIATIN